MSKILITGGAGFGGSYLAKLLLEYAHIIKVIDIISPNHANNLRREIDRGSIEYSWKAIQDTTESDYRGYDYIYHFAAQADVPAAFSSSVYTSLQNVSGLVHVLECVKNLPIKRFVLPSSANAQGYYTSLPIDESQLLKPHNPYGASKASQELYCLAYYRAYGLPVVILRNGIVYGPNMRRDVFIFRWMKNIIQGKPIIVEGGDQTRDPCFISDAANAWILAIESDKNKTIGETFNVSTGDEYTIKELANKIISLTNFKDVGIIFEDYRPGEHKFREKFSIEKAGKILGYSPEVTLEEGLEMTWKWVKEVVR